MKNVTHVITTVARGGAENQLKVLVREQIKFGYKVEVIYLKGEPELRDELISLGAVVIDFCNGKNLLSQICFLKKYISMNLGIVHAHLPRAEIVTALAAHKNSFLVTRHNSEPFYPNAPRWLSTLLSRFVAKRCHTIIAISHAVKSYLLSSKEVVSADQIEVIHYGYDSSFWEKNPERIRNTTNCFVIGSIGRLVEQKDFATLLKSFKFFCKEHPNSQLQIVGEGVLGNELKELAKDLNIENNITWVGRTEDVPAQLMNMDIFVLASKYEGFGMVLLEAIQAGLPVLAANNTAIPEVLGENSSGLFETSNSIDLWSKLEKFYDERSRISLKSEQQLRLSVFTPLKMFKEVESVYKELQVMT